MIGIFGGTFDPVHFGHLRSAWEVREALRFTDFRLMPAGQPPHRDQPVTAAQHRLAMLRLAIRGLPGMQIDDREVHRSGPSWMVETLHEIRSEAGESPVSLIIGQDSAAGLEKWHRWRELAELAHIVILRRPGGALQASAALEKFYQDRRAGAAEELATMPAGRVWSLEVTQLDVSSSAIRKLVRDGRSPRFLLPDSVLEYIGREGLYR